MIFSSGFVYRRVSLLCLLVKIFSCILCTKYSDLYVFIPLVY